MSIEQMKVIIIKNYRDGSAVSIAMVNHSTTAETICKFMSEQESDKGCSGVLSFVFVDTTDLETEAFSVASTLNSGEK